MAKAKSFRGYWSLFRERSLAFLFAAFIVFFISSPVFAAGVSINNGAGRTWTTKVTLFLTPPPVPPLEVKYTKARISNDNVIWSDYDLSTTIAWTLTLGTGTKTVYVKFLRYDPALGWLQSSVYSDTITYASDTKSPLPTPHLSCYPGFTTVEGFVSKYGTFILSWTSGSDYMTADFPDLVSGLNGYYVWLQGPPSASQWTGFSYYPILSDLFPKCAAQNETLYVYIYSGAIGTPLCANWTTPPTVSFGIDINVLTREVISPNTLRVKIHTLSGTALGPHQVTVGSLMNGLTFNVFSPTAPSITGVFPDSGAQGSSIWTAIQGYNTSWNPSSPPQSFFTSGGVQTTPGFGTAAYDANNLLAQNTFTTPGIVTVEVSDSQGRATFLVGSIFPTFKIFGFGTQLPEGTYTAEVLAWDRAGNFSASNVVNFYVDKTSPEAPSNLSFSSAWETLSATPPIVSLTGKIKLSWDAAVDNPGGGGIGSYRIYPGGPYSGYFYTQTPVTSFDFSAYNLEDSNYSFRVAAIDRAGNVGPLSEPATIEIRTIATPEVGAPPGTIRLHISRAGSDIMISWEGFSVHTYLNSLNFYVLTGDGTGTFTNNFIGTYATPENWKPATASTSYDFTHYNDYPVAYFLHKNQVGRGTTEAYYKGIFQTSAMTNIAYYLPSAEAVGKVNVGLDGTASIPGYNLVSVPFTSESRSVSSVFGTGSPWVNGDQILKKAGPTPAYLTAVYDGTTYPSEPWRDAGNTTNVAAFEINTPLHGYFVSVKAPKPITLVGKVFPAPPDELIWGGGYTILSLAFPTSTTLNASGLLSLAADQDSIFYKTSATSPAYIGAVRVSGQWKDVSNTNNDPPADIATLRLPSGYFFSRASAGELHWLRSLP